MFKKILWATDGSAASDAAMPAIEELASGESEVVVFHSDLRFVGPRAYGEPVFADEAELKEKIRSQASALEKSGASVEIDIIGGNTLVGAAQDIVAAVERHGADVIVVATRGHTALGGLLLGSVTQRLLHIAPCPVLVIPSREAEAS